MTPIKKEEVNDAMANAFIRNVTDFLSSSAKRYDQRSEDCCNLLQYFLMRHAAFFEGYDSDEIFCGDYKYDAKDVISSYGQETLKLSSNGVKDCGILATLPETVTMPRHKFPQISTVTLYVEEELKERVVIVILLLLFASEAENWTATCDPVAERYSVEEIAASQTPPPLPALTAPLFHPMTNSCDTCVKVATEKNIIAKQTLDKKRHYCLAFTDERRRSFREAKNTKVSQKMFWRKCLPFLLVSIAFVILVRLYLQLEITEWLFWTHVTKQVQSPWPCGDMTRGLQSVPHDQNATKRYIPEEWEHSPSNKEHHLAFGKECEACPDSAYFSTTRDDDDAHSNSSEISDHGYEGAAHVIANDVRPGIQETDYCQNDTYTAWQLKAVGRGTLVLDRNAPQPLKSISCSDVGEETSNQHQVKVDNLSTRYSRSPHPSVFNRSQMLNNASPLPREHIPSGRTMLPGLNIVTGHQQPICDANQNEGTTTLNDQPRTGNIGEQTTSVDDHTYEDHRPNPSTSVIIALPEPLGIVCVFDTFDISVSESHE